MSKPLNGKKKIIYARIASLLIEKGLTQKDFSEGLSKLSDKPITQANVSLWATGERPVPQKHLPVICEFLEVSDAYLLGLTDDKTLSCINAVTEETSKVESKRNYEIDYAQLYAYDKCPVFIVFPHKEHIDAWALYSKDASTFTSINWVLTEKDARNMGLKYYVTDIRNLEDPLNQRKALDYKKMLEAEGDIYVHMKTADPEVHAEYDGWYHHDANHKFLIDNKGHILPYEGYKDCYVAYSYRFKASMFND